MKCEAVIPRASFVESLLVTAVLLLLLGTVTDRGRDYRARSARFAVADLANGPCNHHRWIDPWGMPFVVYCGEHSNVAQSFGPDLIPNTSDDIWSNR